MDKQQVVFSEWKSSANKAFWGVILTSFAGIISTIYDYVSYVVNFIEFISTRLSSMLNGFGGSRSLPSFDLSPFIAWGFSAKGLIIIGYILYLWGLTSFAATLRTESSVRNVKKVRSATILLIITFFLAIVFGVFSIIPFAGMFFGFITWVLFLVCFYKMKYAWEKLMVASDFNPRAQRGARNLRYAACCEIRLKWLPLVTGLIVIFIAFMFILMVRSAKSFEQLEAVGKIGATVVVIVLFVAAIVALFAMFCAFFWPIIGWYRIKTGGPALEEQEAPSQEMMPEQTQEFVEAQEQPEKDGFVETIEESHMESSEAETDNRKKRYIAGGVLAAILIGIGLWFAFSGSSGNNPLGVEKPTWNKFVVVISQDVPLHKDARSDSPKLMGALENLGSDMAAREFRWEDQGKKRGYTLYPYHLEKNDVLPVLDETDTWYKVQVYNEDMNGMIETAYVKKEWTREIYPEPITEEVLARIGKTMQRTDHIVKSGKLKNLCLTTHFDDMNGESFQIGALIDGILVYPQYKGIFLKKEGVSGIDFQKNEEYDNYTITYGEDYQIDLDEYSKVFNPKKLTDETIGQMFEAVNQVNPSAPIVVEYYFPEANKDYFFKFAYIAGESNANVSTDDKDAENTKVTGYRVSGHELLAELGETYEGTNIIEDCDIEIAEIGDYDGNGDMEVIIYKKDGESDELTEPPFMVFYDYINKEYKRTEPFLLTFWVNKEDRDGKTSLIQAKGLHKVRYVFDGKRLKQVQNTIEGVGRALKKLTCKELYPDGGIDDRIVRFDIDGDGNMESIVFGHNDSRACGYGRDMFIDKIRWESGRTIGDEYFGLQSASTFSILESMTNGMHDILLDESWYFRWNGSIYEQWTWDGSVFVKMGG